MPHKVFTFLALRMIDDPELRELFTKLIKHTTRLFYTPQHCVVMDILLSKLLLKDHEFLERLHILPKEFNKIVVKLKEDKLLKVENRIENVDGRQFIKTIFYLDFCMIKDVIKYKLYKMTQINKAVSIEMYICKSCEREYSILEAQTCIQNFKFVCVDCHSLLEEKKCVEFDHIMHNKMMTHINEISKILQAIDKYEIQNIDYFQALKMREEREKEVVVEDKKEVVIENVCDTFDDEDVSIPVPINKNKPRIEEKVMVNGVEKWIDDVDEHDKVIMTEDEYETYYEIYSKYNPE